MNLRTFLRNSILNLHMNDKLLSNNKLGCLLLVHLLLLRIYSLKDISTLLKINLVKLIAILRRKLEGSCMHQIIKIKIVTFSLEERNNILLLFKIQTAILHCMIPVLLHQDHRMGFFLQQEGKHKVHFFLNFHWIQLLKDKQVQQCYKAFKKNLLFNKSHFSIQTLKEITMLIIQMILLMQLLNNTRIHFLPNLQRNQFDKQTKQPYHPLLFISKGSFK